KKLLPMGRNATEEWNCTRRCLRDKKPKRFAVMPNGNIIFQTCDGVYPIVGNIENPFNLEEYLEQIKRCRKYTEKINE
ncbi:unnamed protein product, partial [marine sediment metagenome]